MKVSVGYASIALPSRPASKPAMKLPEPITSSKGVFLSTATPPILVIPD